MVHETHKICLWLECIRNFNKEFTVISAIKFNRNYSHKTRKIWHANDQNYSSYCLLQYFSKGVRKFWKFQRGGGVNLGGGGLISQKPEGRGVIRQIPSMDVVWIFSGTIHWKFHQCILNNSFNIVASIVEYFFWIFLQTFFNIRFHAVMSIHTVWWSHLYYTTHTLHNKIWILHF